MIVFPSLIFHFISPQLPFSYIFFAMALYLPDILANWLFFACQIIPQL